VQFVDNAFYPTAWKTRSSLGWERGGVSLAGFLNWQDGSKFVTSTGTQPMSAFTTVDLDLNIDFSQMGQRALRGLKLTVSAENLLDANPPFINVPGGFDSINASPLGRFVSVRLARTW
jgi:iron complex outermembrane receptor protein